VLIAHCLLLFVFPKGNAHAVNMPCYFNITLLHCYVFVMFAIDKGTTIPVVPCILLAIVYRVLLAAVVTYERILSVLVYVKPIVISFYFNCSHEVLYKRC